MFTRGLQNDLHQAMGEFPVVALLGPRQAGKTTLARWWISDRGPQDAIYLDLELPSDLAKLTDAQGYLESFADRVFVLDEIRQRPELFPILRGLVDRARRPGRFLLLGSASPKLLRQGSESLAGRLSYLELPLLLRSEVRRSVELNEHWWRGGYPEAIQAETPAACTRWLEALIRSYVERDLPGLGLRLEPTDLRRFWTMLAHGQGTLWNAQRLGSNFGVTIPTVQRYLAFFEQAFLVRVLRPWHANVGKRLVKSPKVYVRDSGLLHTLLAIADQDGLHGHPVLGASWEGFVVEQIAGMLRPPLRLHFFRTHAGAELDLVIAEGERVCAAVEIKCTTAPSVTRGFYNALADVGSPPGWVLHRGMERFPIADGVEAIGLEEFLEGVLPGLASA